jgi:hypothetical protein
VRALIKKASRPPINAQSAAEMTHAERVFIFKAGRKVTLSNPVSLLLIYSSLYVCELVRRLFNQMALWHSICSVFIKTENVIRSFVCKCGFVQRPKAAVLQHPH